ncbi:MAG: cytochrome c [Candidatus Hydrogenedentes bacterium]|nr:cytochrome c [Candidatus Hydrogenedentota bacterium]
MKVSVALILLATVSIPGVGIAEPVTYTKDVAPILYKNCASCHHPGEIAPFSVMDYESTRAWAKSIRKVVHERTMPPWHADSTKTEYANDRSLSESDVETIVAWVTQGAKRGDPADLPTAPKFDDTWAMGTPDMIFHVEKGFLVPANGNYIEYQSLHFAPVLEEDLYITEWEIRPTVRKSVHHANLVRAPNRLTPVGIGQAVMGGGDYIGSYLPGARPLSYPEGTAYRIPAGNMIQIQVHYIGLDEDFTDEIMFGVKFAQGRIDQIVRTVGTDDYEISIEPYDDNWVMDTEVTLLYDLTLLSSGAHMHLRGSGYTTTALLPDGTERLIADVPRYDFNWQSNYELANPVSLPKMTKYHVRATWDNSDKNPNNPDPSAKVVYGKWTENEMLTTWSHAVLTHEKLGLKIKDGRVVGRYPDAQESPHPALLQSLPNTMNPKRFQNTDD